MGKFFDSAIQLGVVNGKEVINVSSSQTEGFRDVTLTFMGEKDHSCAFVTMQQQCSKQGSAFSSHGDTNSQLENTFNNLNVHIIEEKVEPFRNSWGVKRNLLRHLVLVQLAWKFCLLDEALIKIKIKNKKLLGMRSFNSVCGKFVQRVLNRMF